jgi:hypothetical protein
MISFIHYEPLQTDLPVLIEGHVECSVENASDTVPVLIWPDIRQI